MSILIRNAHSRVVPSECSYSDILIQISHSLLYSTGEMSCKFCGKTFNRRFNLKRHESDYCPLRHENSDTDDDSQDMKSDDDDISTASNSEHTQSSEADGSESGSGSEVENESDPWEPLIEEAKERNVSEYEEIKQNFIERGLDEESASSQAYSLILPKLQKDLESVYLERLLWMRQLKKNRVHRKVMNTRDEFINGDDFDHDEALEAAVDKRKFLLKRLLKDNSFIEDENADNNVD